MQKIIHTYDRFIHKLKSLDFTLLLALRIYLAPIFIVAGLNKLNSFNATSEWLGNSDWGLDCLLHL